MWPALARLCAAPLAALALAAAGCTSARTPAAPRVEAGGETLVGEWLDAQAGLAVFRGIPYAAAPTGPRRWRPPEAHSPRPGARKATRFGPACPQLDDDAEWYRDVAASFGRPRDAIPDLDRIDEDCLTLNVWTRSLGDRARAPVMVWIHGGGNQSGHAADPNYLGHELARRGVVFVSIQYRLGALGFLAHPALGAESERGVSGNYGLLDQIAALRWVRRHIGAFGGDPERVTAFGESAGAGDIGTLIASPLGRGLFRRAILQSGGYPLNRARALHDEEADGLRLQLALLGPAASDPLPALRAAPWREILETAKRALPGHAWDPVMDGWLLPAPEAAIFAAGKQGPVELLIGTNQNEWRMYLPDPATEADLREALEAHLRPEDRAAALALLGAGDAPPLRDRLDRLVGAAEFHCPSLAIARAVAARGDPVFVYRFTRVRPGGAKLLAYHGAEIPYVFDTADAWLPADETDRALTRAMLAYWVDFAGTGDPNGPGLPQWPPFDARREDHQVLGDRVHPARGLDPALCRLLDRKRPAGSPSAP